ncbi:protein PHOTOPERIOD-INDEPENDENT EARLY FLOWERING 1 isoform X1 [Ipomoea triloba]|uniref:protein PHOTOPERIOD-INDEPENDENT EARLY FLOWERING 1 isoform X1 n=2 Tax=Ipomoea triloba TaxID=35885 RepID=UPI00125CE59B|nr:protein PHOTOPERIOD-INDEPENDENT EARLY FLOWERING 1 isoform X1 [Ipomoea triloba]
MSSKGSKTKPDHETRARRQKALEAPKEPPRPKTHWDHVLEEMVWLSKDFESERKWKLAQAKKVAIRASKGVLDQASRGEKRVKEEEQRLRKVALNISKDVKKFWLKIEKLVLYKHQLELDEKKKKTLDKQLEFLLGQTERYSTMLAENLVSSPTQCQQLNVSSCQERLRIQHEEGTQDDVKRNAEEKVESQSVAPDKDDDYDLMSEDGSEDDEHTIEEDEALITREEREEELEALQKEMDLPIEELLKRYHKEQASRGSSPDENGDVPEATVPREDNAKDSDFAITPEIKRVISSASPGRGCVESNGVLSVSDNHLPELEPDKHSKPPKKLQESDKVHSLDEINDEQFLQDGDDDEDFVATFEETECYMDDETTLLEEEELAKADPNDATNEIALLKTDCEIPIAELLARYKKDYENDENMGGDSESSFSSASEEFSDSPTHKESELKNESRDVQPIACPEMEDKEADAVVNSGEEKESENRLADAAAAARSAQPTGNTFSTTKVRTKFPFLLKYPLREYQHIGLDWLVTMYEKKLNGILADEMGLGKTIMTIALLAHLACEKGIWGPHLIVVPTSVMLNWETEFLKWCPAFKILTYFGSAKERKIKRQGWLKPNSFHVCITTYRLVIQDSKVFKRKKWKYLILDEAHLIKNWKSQRWQTLLNFNSKRRILLTGTPLQNDLMELWSLMHFLMPHIFQSHQEFKDWFCNPISGIVEGQEKVNKEVVDRLHNVLRPFLLRRLKRDVEKQLPSKHEHVIYCRLSKRQRNLYEDFIASAETQATLASTNFFGMISVIMQLRKVCNHPDLFEGRPIVSSFDMNGVDVCLSSSICSMFTHGPFSAVDLIALGFLFTHLDYSMASWESDDIQAIATPPGLFEGLGNLETGSGLKNQKKLHGSSIFEEIQRELMADRLKEKKERAATLAWWNSLKCKRKPIYSTGLREVVTVKHPVRDIHSQKINPFSYCSSLANIVLPPVARFQQMVDQVESFMFTIPAARAPPPVCWCSKSGASVFFHPTFKERCTEVLSPLLTPFRPAIVRRQLYFPDRRLIQFDCGKLQELAVLLRRLKSEGHRALIFTQMTKMLDVLETFINLYGYTYMRLDGSTLPEERQTLMQRFNTNPKIFLFILSTRSGGVGINLVGADTVIFYDSDWNPAMDQQAQDRCHRIGQTREVHIYRLISESTIEENILKKANQKRALDDLVIQSGGYNTEFFKKLDPIELFSGHRTLSSKNAQSEKSSDGTEVPLSNDDVEAALKNAEDEADYMALKKVEQEEAVDNQEFTEEAIGRMEDDEFGIEEEIKADDTDNVGLTISNKEKAAVSNGSDPTEDRAITLAGKDEDVDVLDDVKHMAEAAAAAGQAILSFDSQLRPIDRYAVRFLELWDPIIDKTAVELQDQFEEREWELDHIEKLKEDMEAEMDDDEEPLVYERWDADFATKAYRQQVEALTQIQLMEEMESKAREKELAEYENSIGNDVAAPSKPKSKKKTKKTKFKSLKKGGLGSETKSMKEESPIDLMSTDDEIICQEDVTTPDFVSSHSAQFRKRKQAPDDEESKQMKKSKKFKKASEVSPLALDLSLPGMQQDESIDLKHRERSTVDLELKPLHKSKMGGRVSIAMMPVKRIFTLKPEKLKKKGNLSSKDYFPSADQWLPQEDAILCAAVYEYGPHWRLVSDILYGITGGGLYRGRFRHPVHCSERFRELIQRYVFSASDVINSERANNISSGKGLLKVTEENIQTLLDVALELPDREPLIQKHFFALLSSVWRSRKNDSCRRSSSQSGFNPLLLTSTANHFSQNSVRPPQGKLAFTNLSQCNKLVGAALSENSGAQTDNSVSISKQREEAPVPAEELDITLELQAAKDDNDISFPPLVHLKILDPDSSPSLKTRTPEHIHLKSSPYVAESRFRETSNTCFEACLDWPSITLPPGEPRCKTPAKPQSQGKQKLAPDSSKASKSRSRKVSVEHSDLCPPTEQIFQPASFSNDPIAAMDTSSSLEEACLHHDFETSSLFNTNGEFKVDLTDFVPHSYIPGLLSGLDDCSTSSPTFPEFTDIG